MTLIIAGLTFPTDPDSMERRSIRAPQTNSILEGFPGFTSNTTQKFALVFKGFLWPQKFADEVFERLKNPETETITVFFDEEPWIDGLHYSTERLFIDRKRPFFTQDDQGNTVKAYPYQITLTQLADSGSNKEADEEGSENGEKAGFFDIPLEETVPGLEDVTEVFANMLPGIFHKD